MLEKESIYCCKSGGSPLLGGVGRFLGVESGEVRWGGRGVHAGPLHFFPCSFSGTTPGTEAPEQLRLPRLLPLHS